MDGKNSSKSSFPNIKLRHPTNSKHNKCAPFVGYEQSKWLWCGLKGSISFQAPIGGGDIQNR
jgi:hypothetical protein